MSTWDFSWYNNVNYFPHFHSIGLLNKHISSIASLAATVFQNIACEFVRESLPRTSKKMTLWDPMGKPWDVSYVYYGDRAAGSFGGGWGRFALGNNLEKSDVCVFELFEEDNMRVHIYRVVPEITPLLRASNKD
jgi:hypothetical protein